MTRAVTIWILGAAVFGFVAGEGRAQLPSDPAEVAAVVGNPQALLALSADAADEVAQPAPPVPAAETRFTEDEKFWWVPERQKAAASAQIVLQRNPYLVAVMRLHGQRLVVWGEDEFLSDRAPALTSEWLDEVKDGPLPDYSKGKWRDIPFWELPNDYKVYNEALVKAANVPVDAFQQSAKENTDLTFSHMYKDPWKYRGAVVKIEGTLKRLRKYDAPLLARDEDVRHVYEGWVFLDTPGTHPVCVIFPHLPGQLAPAENVNARVVFYGYFLMKYRYTTSERYTDKAGTVRNRQRDTLLLIGPTLLLDDPLPPPTFWPAENTQLALMVIVAAIAALLIIMLMGLWYRRGDQKIRAEVERIRASKAVQFEDEELGDNLPEPLPDARPDENIQ